jgi:hypothetical protein
MEDIWTMEKIQEKGKGESAWHWSIREEITIFLDPGRREQVRQEQGRGVSDHPTIAAQKGAQSRS